MMKTEFKKAVGAIFKAAHFLSKGQSWFKVGNDAIVFINLQKSDFDEKYYVNFGIWIKELAPTDDPAASKCHIQSRLTSMFPEEAISIDSGCHLSATESEVAEFLDFLSRAVIPFCDDCTNIKNLRTLVANGRFKKALVMKVARELLTSS